PREPAGPNLEPCRERCGRPLDDRLAPLLAQTYRGVSQASRLPSCEPLRIACLTALHVTAAPPLDVRKGAKCHAYPALVVQRQVRVERRPRVVRRDRLLPVPTQHPPAPPTLLPHPHPPPY